MKITMLIAVIAVSLLYPAGSAYAGSISGKVNGSSGKPLGGVMLSAFDKGHRKFVSVFSRPDGSFRIDGLRDVKHDVRARLMGFDDDWSDGVKVSAGNVKFRLKAATGDDLQDQRPASSGFSMLKFDNKRDKLNFKMMCSYCHQVGTVGFRTPEQPVDWETMVRRMDGFGGLYRHTQKTIVKRLLGTYKEDAIRKWPVFVPPPAPAGLAAKARITAWELGKKLESSFHDLELGPDGLVYAVNISKHRIVTLDPASGEQLAYQLPRGSYGPIPSSWQMMAICG
ncbi:MAG: carboxypeptidase-like regulatory domain-containing protein [Planctomycetes bacterium]|nr:carboxypeptidase-like regulatory domain-containing protein [Planctomycetota bacterium]